MTPQLKQLFDGLSDAVIMLSADATTRFANQAATTLIGARVGEKIASSVLQKEIVAAAGGYSSFPKTLELEQNVGKSADTKLHALLLNSPMGKDFIVILTDATARSKYDNTLANLCEFITGELSAPLKDLQKSVQTLWGAAKSVARDATELEAPLQETRKAGSELLSKLSKLSNFAELFGQARIVTDDRLAPRDIVLNAWEPVKSRAASKKIKCAVSGLSNDLPYIYGSKRWLNTAVGELFENAVRCCPPEGEIDITAKATGTFLVLSVRNRGFGPSAKDMPDLQEPFNGQGPREEPVRRLGLGLPMAHRIITSHGGNLRVESEDGQFVQFVLELPVGAPKNERDHLDHELLQRYAQDLAQVMARRQKAAAVPGR